MTWRLTENPNHPQIALFCFSPPKTDVGYFGEGLSCYVFAWSKTSSTVVNKKPDMRTISNSRHRTRARNSISSTTPNTRSIPSKYRLWHFLNIYMWSGLPILFTDGFNTFKRGIIHSFEAADLASIRCIKSISTECRSKASDFMCTQTTVTHFYFAHGWKKIKSWKLHNHSLFILEEHCKLAKPPRAEERSTGQTRADSLWNL